MILWRFGTPRFLSDLQIPSSDASFSRAPCTKYMIFGGLYVNVILNGGLFHLAIFDKVDVRTCNVYVRSTIDFILPTRLKQGLAKKWVSLNLLL